MKLIEIVNARCSLQKLIAQDLPLHTAFEVMELVERCNKHLGFFSQMRQKLGAQPDEEKLAELENFEVTDLGELPIEILAEESMRLSASDVKALEPFVKFIL